ncbi:MAG: metallophosphoesterase [Sphingomonadales bacterium]|nr:metallophosphoesterase [Sphingomonadales bacterium]
MPAAVTLFHVSDLHFGMEDRAALDWFAREVAEVRPDGVICTGDLTMRGRTREFAAAADYLAGLAAPVSVEPGNHDMPYYWEPVARLARPHARFEVLRKAVHRDLCVDGVALVSLPTIAPAQWRLNWSKGRVHRGRLAHALAHLHDLGCPDAGGLRLVACHHPLVEAGTHATASTRGGPHALAALARAGVDAVLSGHVHDAFDKVVEAGGRPIRLIGAGTLSERVRTTRPSYNRLAWAAETGLRVDVRTV